MFDVILIANRGEIACRVMQTAQKMGVRCVAVYSDADAGAKHVQMADHAVHIGASAPAESYLRADRIIEAALATGAQAIHPGYGFLSENPEFVDQVEAAGLVFIGPSADAIRAMGLKDAAKALMEEAGVPVVPGYHGQEQDPALLARRAGEIGYPVLIKAVAGGGGKGMRFVDTPEAFADALASAQGEAKTAFGNSEVLVEKFVTHPRHIEVQIFGDGVRAVHLFERDCSLQRRHQKVIEEAPAPGMTEDVRQAMGAAAVRAAEAIGYKGAGTVEFIVDGKNGLRSDGFWFMEMNTRLQVEHPVTEAITGVDLVEWQLRVAAGEALPCRQDQLHIEGHAFEARLYAEDVPKGFLPSTGTLTHLNFPEDARADSGVRAGDEISPWYDPMIAKITVHGPTRDIALRRLVTALERTEVAGTVTNLAFLGALATHQGFARGEVDTGLIARDHDALLHRPGFAPLHAVAAGMAVTGLDQPGAEAGFALWGALRQTVGLGWKGAPLEVAVEVLSRDAQDWWVDGSRVAVRRVDGRFMCEGRPLPRVAVAAGSVTVFDQYGLDFDIIDPLARTGAAAAAGNVVQAPMPGLIKAVFVETGSTVSLGDRLAILEAMKMEHTLTAERDGIVAEVLASTGLQVAAGDVLIQLEEQDET